MTKAIKSIVTWAPKGNPDRFFTADEARQAALEIDEEYPPEIVATTDLPTALPMQDRSRQTQVVEWMNGPNTVSRVR